MMKAKRLWAATSVLAFLPLAAFGATGGTISGTVTDPRGAPLKGSFVQARDAKTRITVVVLTDSKGRYRMENVPAGEYDVLSVMRGFRSELRRGVKVNGQPAAPIDLPAAIRPVRWNELSIHEAMVLLPDAKGKKELFTSACVYCHGFQVKMAAARRSEDRWRKAVEFMRPEAHYFMGDRFNDQMVGDLVSYLTKVFGSDSELGDAAALPDYAKLQRQWTDEALNIQYVLYDLPGLNRFPWSAKPGSNGQMWIPYYGRNSGVAKLDPRTGAVQEFTISTTGATAVHSAIEGQDGSVWAALQAENRVVKLDPKTGTLTDYKAPGKLGLRGAIAGGAKSTARLDPQGNIWISGVPLSKLDTKTGKFTEFWQEAPSTYSVEVDKDGNTWYSVLLGQEIGRYDAKTGKIQKWIPPTANSGPRRITSDAQGMIWFAQWNAGKMARFDPKTETFREYPLPGGSPSPYAISLDKNGDMWYSSYDMDVVGRLNPRTGAVTEFPFPYSENASREYFMDAEGRMWFATPPNNKVGYFFLKSESPLRSVRR